MYKARFLRPQVNTKGLLAHYKMWDGFMATNKVFDYALNANLGTTTMITYGSYPGYKFNPAGSQINCGSGVTLDNIFDGGGSFSGWIKPLSQGAVGQGRVFDKSTNVTIGAVLFCPTSNIKLQFTQVTDNTDGQWTFPVDITGEIWQHIVLTYNADASANNPIVYINGESVVVTETSTPDDTRTSDAAAIMYLGVKAAGGFNWDGYMDDFMFFNRILTAAEAKSIFSVTRSRYGV